jgi:hypothetical protein
MKPNRIERRADLRAQFSNAVKCMTPEVLFEAEAVNLGRDGICVRSPLSFEPGTEMALLFSFTSSGDAPILALAEVIWCEDSPAEEQPNQSNLLGLQFRHLGRHKASLLAWQVRQLALAGGMLACNPQASL